MKNISLPPWAARHRLTIQSQHSQFGPASAQALPWFRLTSWERELAARLRDRTMLGKLPGAMRCLSFLLVTAAPLHALAQEERPVPPLPIPDVAPTANHSRARLPPPLPRPRPAPMATSAAAAPIAPKKTLVQIND